VPLSAPESPVAFARLTERAQGAAVIVLATRAISRRPFAQPFANGPPAVAL
jgi:hypothetical protein